MPPIFNFLKNEFLEVIEWIEESRDVIIWKFPDEQKDIKYGAQLTVRESQNAIFLNEGQVADVFLAGRYDLVTNNIPIMTKLRGWKYGFQSPFKADVYFVNMRQFTNLKWGTANPIILRDPELKQVRVRAYGTYSIKISSPQLFFKEYGGTSPVVTIGELEEQLRNVVVSKFTDAIGEANVSVYDFARNFNELGDKILPLLIKEFSLLGVEIVNFFIQSTSLPPEVEAFLDKMTQMNMAGDVNKFSQFQMANSIPDLAKNQGAGVAALGASFAMGNQMMQQAQGQPPPKTESKEDIMKTLKDLAGLKDAGVLTQEEFDKKKAELLAKL
jgi:membrane protease subunit (stomatin/prohibitin family)